MIDIFENKLRINEIIIKELKKNLKNIEYDIKLFSNQIYFQRMYEKKIRERQILLETINKFSKQIEK